MWYFKVRRRKRRTRRSPGKKLFEQYKEQARELVHKKIIELNQHYNFSFNRVFIKNHRSRWGSCSKKKNLNFNYRILFLPLALAEYVVVHELCHLVEFNHSRNFWNLVASAVPDFRERRRSLRQVKIERG